MSSAESNSQRPSAHLNSESEPHTPAHVSRAEATAEERLLELIIQETEKLLLAPFAEKKPGSAADDGLLDAADMGVVRAMAQRRRGEPFALDPILTELTAALLEKTFREHVNSPGEWTALTTRVAHTLYDDPTARDRIRAMWERMAGGGAP